MVIDCHNHLGVDLFFYLNGYYPYAQDVPTLATEGGRNGVDRWIVFPMLANLWFDLKAMQAQGNFEIREVVGAEQQAMVTGDVEQLDGEDVRGTMKFIEREKQRRRIALAHPPLGRVVEVLEVFRSDAFDDAEDVEVGVARAEFGGDGRTVEHDGFQVGLGRDFQTAYEFS